MAPSLSKLKEYQSSLICLSGLSAAAWIIIYGKTSNKKRWVFDNWLRLCIRYESRMKREIFQLDVLCFMNRSKVVRTFVHSHTRSAIPLCKRMGCFIFIFEQFKFIIGVNKNKQKLRFHLNYILECLTLRFSLDRFARSLKTKPTTKICAITFPFILLISFKWKKEDSQSIFQMP